MKIWHCNWASTMDADCQRDDANEIDRELMANPNGVLLKDIDKIEEVQALVVEEDRDLYDGHEPSVWVLQRSTDEYREYVYGEYLLVCSLKEVM